MTSKNDKHSFESVTSGFGIRGKIRQEIDEKEKAEQRDARHKHEPDPYSYRKPGQPRRSDDDENFL